MWKEESRIIWSNLEIRKGNKVLKHIKYNVEKIFKYPFEKVRKDNYWNEIEIKAELELMSAQLR